MAHFDDHMQHQVDAVFDELNAIYEERATDEDNMPLNYFDWLNDALDIEYTLDSNRELIGARIYVTLGGPTVWIDTRHNEIVCRWGCDKVERWLPSEISYEINGMLRECWE